MHERHRAPRQRRDIEPKDVQLGSPRSRSAFVMFEPRNNVTIGLDNTCSPINRAVEVSLSHTPHLPCRTHGVQATLDRNQTQRRDELLGSGREMNFAYSLSLSNQESTEIKAQHQTGELVGKVKEQKMQGKFADQVFDK